MTGGALLIGLVIIAVAVVTSRPAATGDTSWVTPAVSLSPTVPKDGTTLGSPAAPVTLDVYSDFQCPVCGKFAREYLPQLVRDFVTPGTLRIVDHPVEILGAGTPNESLQAAIGATCAGREGHYWDYHDALMWNQNGENLGAFSQPRLLALASQLGLDRTAFDACFSDPAVTTEVVQATTASGVNQTPTFVIGGQRIVGLISYADLATKIRAGAAQSPAAPSGS